MGAALGIVLAPPLFTLEKTMEIDATSNGPQKLGYLKRGRKQVVQYSARIEQKLMDKIEVIAGRDNVSINKVINQAIEKGLTDGDTN